MTARIEAIRRRTGSALLARPQDYAVGCIMISQPVLFAHDYWIADHADWQPRVQGARTVVIASLVPAATSTCGGFPLRAAAAWPVGHHGGGARGGVTLTKYRMYVDEVGNADLRSSDDPNHRFLSLTGVVIGLGHVESVVLPQMEGLKSAFFGSHPDDPVILHRKELVNRRGPFVSLRDPAVNAAFDGELLGLMRSWDYTVISVFLDKKAHRQKYTVWQYDPSHYCLAVLLARYVYFLNRHGVQGDVIAESRGGNEDRRLKESFARLCEKGSGYADAAQMSRALTSGQLKVKQKSNNLAGLQLADLVAHPSRNEILNENGHAMTIAPFAAKVIAVLQSKYDQRDGRVFGKKML